MPPRCLALVFLAALAPGPQDPEELPDPYPPARADALLRFYSLQGDVDVTDLQAAVADLGEGARVFVGPAATDARPRDHFVGIRTPAGVSERDVRKAAREGARKVEPLLFTIYRAQPQEGARSDRYGFVTRDTVVGMASEMRWWQRLGGIELFFYTEGDFDAAEAADRMNKLSGREGAYVPERDLLRESFTWELEGEVSDSQARRVEKAVSRVPGVTSATLDAGAGRLHVTLVLADLSVGGPPLPLPDGAGERPVFLVDPIVDALEDAGLRLRGAEEETPEAGGGTGGR